MKRIKEQENIKIEKFERVFSKISEVTHKLKVYNSNKLELNKKIDHLQSILDEWDVKISNQKEVYKIAVEECRKEESLVDEMGKALEKLKLDVNKDSHDFNNLFSPQYEMALKAIESLNSTSFNELKSFRSPPQQVQAVVNTLCLMFRQPPGWDSGKLLLLRNGFYQDLIFYDKKNIPDDIFKALEQICNVDTFRPEFVRCGSLAAASFCEWILAVYKYSKFERTVGLKTKELKQFEFLYNERLATLGEKK